MRNFLVILCIIATAGPLRAQEWKRFSDTAILFTARYPASWTSKIKEGNRVFFTSPAETREDRFLENVNISVTINPSYGVTVQIRDLFPDVTNRIRNSLKDFKDEGQRFFKLNGQDACEIKYSGLFKENDDMRIHIIQWFCFYKTRLYTITFTAETSNSLQTQTALKIMQSIRFVD